MGDIHESNMEFLTKVMEIQAASDQAMEGISKVISGGAEGLRAVMSVPSGANSVVVAFANLKLLVGIQRELIKDLAEENTEIMDRLAKLTEDLEDPQ